MLEPATAQVSPEELLEALQMACDARDWAQVGQLLLENPTAFGAGDVGVLMAKGLIAEEVWAFCRCLPAGVALPTIEFKLCSIDHEISGDLPDDREPCALAYLTSHTGLRGLGFRMYAPSEQALTQLAEGAEQRQQRGDRGLQFLYVDCEPSRYSPNGVVGSAGMARLIASSPHLEALMISGYGAMVYSSGGANPADIDLSDAIGALGGLKHLQTLVIKSLRPGSLGNENIATQCRRLAENPPPMSTIVLAGWDLGSDDDEGLSPGSGEAWVDGLTALCEFVARMPDGVTVQLGQIRDDAACNFMQMLGDALNSRTEPFNLHMVTSECRPKERSGFWDEWNSRPVSISSTQTAILDELSGSAPVHSLRVRLGHGEWGEDSTPVRAITGALKRIDGLQRLVLDISGYERSRIRGQVQSAHDARSDLLAAVEKHPGLSSLVFPREPERSDSVGPAGDPDWKRLSLAKRILKSTAKEMVRRTPIGNFPSELTDPLMRASRFVNVLWAGKTLAQLNRQNYNRWVEFWNARTPQSVASPFFKQLTPLAPGNSDLV